MSVGSEVSSDIKPLDEANDAEIVGDRAGDTIIVGRVASVWTGHSVTRVVAVVKHERLPVLSVIVVVDTILMDRTSMGK